jgi:TPR repeat protein
MKITLLIDADIIAYKCAVTNQTANEANSKAASIINRYVNLLQADHALVCLSDKTNWRKKVLPTYKSNRKDIERPILLDYVKQHLMDNFESIIYPGLEADDVMGILSTHPTKIEGKKIIVSEDKDMRSIPGWLYNPSKDVQPLYISEHEADRYHLYQTLTGDSTDGYKGCPNIGPVKAAKILANYHPSDWWGAIVDAYLCEGLSEANALTQSRIARICRATDYDFTSNNVLLWQPSKIKSTNKELVAKDKAVSNLVKATLAQPIKTNASDARYLRARDTYNRVTHYGNKRGFKLNIVSIHLSNITLPFKHQNKELISVFKELIDLAEIGYGKAYLPLALMYKGDQGIQKDESQQTNFDSKAFYWLDNNLGLNDSEIWCDLGFVFLFGIGVDIDFEVAFSCFTRSAKQGNTGAQYSLGRMYQIGQFVDKNYQKAINWYTQSAKQGDPVAQLSLGEMYAQHMGKNDEQAVYWLSQSAKQGDPRAQSYLAEYENNTEALYWHTLAASQGEGWSQYRLGEIYENGEGVEKNLCTAITLYKIAAKNGIDDLAEDRLNALDCVSITNDTFLKAETLRKNKKYIQAIQLFNQLADFGHAESQFYLGLMHFKAEGADLDHDEALYWFHEAAQQKFAPAEYKLGEMYLHGTGIEKNNDEAFFWFNKAAEQSNQDAQKILKKLFLNGKRVDKNKKDTLPAIRSVNLRPISSHEDRRISIKNDSLQQDTNNYKIGDTLPDDSVIFYIDNSKKHGLAVKRIDIPYKVTWDQANQVANECSPEWHLPTMNEMPLLFEQRSIVGGFSPNFYWSSLESSIKGAWLYSFDDGKQISSFKTYANRARAVRSFLLDQILEAKVSQSQLVTYKLGDILSDGSIVFHVDATGQHGVSVKKNDAALVTWPDANYLVKTYGHEWRLPTKGELEILYKRNTVKDLLGRIVWSCNVYNMSSAWVWGFSFGGNQFYLDKGAYAVVCAVRNF